MPCFDSPDEREWEGNRCTEKWYARGSSYCETPLMEYPDFVEKLHQTEPDLGSKLKGFRTLEHVLDWLKSCDYDLRRLDMVTQDEYCHDLFFPLPDRGEYLVFGMT